jgi:hypothetical protein
MTHNFCCSPSCLRATPSRRQTAFIADPSTGAFSVRPRAAGMMLRSALRSSTDKQVRFSDWIEQVDLNVQDSAAAEQVLVSEYKYRPQWGFGETKRLVTISEENNDLCQTVRFSNWVEQSLFDANLPPAHSLRSPTLQLTRYLNLVSHLD